MGEYRSEAEKFVTSFLDYVYEFDILDKLNRKTQKMERSAGVQSLVSQAEAIFPRRIEYKKGETAPELTEAEVTESLTENVVDMRKQFAAKVQANGGVRAMLRAIVEERPDAAEAVEAAKQFFAAEDGKNVST